MIIRSILGRSSHLLPYETKALSVESLQITRFFSTQENKDGKKSRILDKLLPELDPELKEFKERESRVIKDQIGRSKFTDALKAERKDKVRVIYEPEFLILLCNSLFTLLQLFLATPALVPPQSQFLFPSFATYNFRTQSVVPFPETFREAPVTILTMAYQAIGQGQLNEWHKTIFNAIQPLPVGFPQETNNPVRFMNVVYLQGWFWKLTESIIRNSSANALPPRLRDCSSLVVEKSQQAQDHFCEKIAVHNRMMGYVYLIDSNGYIRWRAHGRPFDGELDALVRATKLLVDASTGNLRPNRH